MTDLETQVDALLATLKRKWSIPIPCWLPSTAWPNEDVAPVNDIRALLTSLVQERDELLSFLNGVSPSLTNTPKRNAAGESILSVKDYSRIAWGDIQTWLDELEAAAARLAAVEQERDEARWAARLLEHAYQHDSRPSSEAMQAIRVWPAALTPSRRDT